jgi:hypothetical protein
MQIVIDIDENVFTRLFDNGIEDYAIANDDLFSIAKSIRKGIPLPEGHGNLIQREEAETIFRNAKMALYKQSRTEQIKDFQTRESMLLNAEQLVHLIKPIIEADKAESEDKE